MTDQTDPDVTDPGAGLRGELGAVAVEESTADLVVTGGRVLLPDGRLADRDVAVVGDRVAAVPADATPVVGTETRVVDAADRTVVPGFVDAHDHLDVHAVFEQSYHRYLERGVTAVVSETSSMGAVGPGGVEAFLSATADLPATAFATVPPQALLDIFGDSTNESPVEPWVDLLERDRVVGVGEVGWAHVVGEANPELGELYDRARERDHRIVGHGAGCRGRKLAAFAAVVDDDHEATRPEGVRRRLAAGLHVVGRRGSIRDDLSAIAEADRPRGQVSLCTDGTWPGDDAGMDDVVRAAIRRGIDPVEAVEMATRNPADHFGLDRGRIAPGDRADLVVLDDLERVEVGTVVAGGRVVVRDGDATVGPRPHEYDPRVRDAVDVTVGPDDLDVDADADGPVRAIAADEGLVTRERTVEPPSEDGRLLADPQAGLLKAALFDRRPDHDRGFVGFVAGLGIGRGAVATTLTWERPGLLAVGADDRSMRSAVRAVDRAGGGWAVVAPDDDGDPETLTTLPTPVAGVCADRPRDRVAAGYDELDAALRELGASPDPGMPRASGGSPGPILGIQTLAFPGVPALKIGFSGYLDVIEREVVGLDP